VILGIVQAAPNSTIEQTTLYTEQVNQALLSLPEARHTFQITQPFMGFGGVGLKPWSQRKRSTEEILPEVFGKVGSIAGVQVIATTPSPLPGGSQFQWRSL
jgi:multidrug efflux pump